MTKKHYIKLVEILKFNSFLVPNPYPLMKGYDEHNLKVLDYNHLINDLVLFLKEDNPNFNEKTFLNALKK